MKAFCRWDFITNWIFKCVLKHKDYQALKYIFYKKFPSINKKFHANLVVYRFSEVLSYKKWTLVFYEISLLVVVSFSHISKNETMSILLIAKTYIRLRYACSLQISGTVVHCMWCSTFTILKVDGGINYALWTLKLVRFMIYDRYSCF